jgi:hypothetical protein
MFSARPRPTLLYILGWGRSGSSILANILGSLSGAASLGEARYLFNRGILENGTCGCGAPFSDCPFWPDLPMGDSRLGDLPSDRARALTHSIGSGARRSQVPALHSPGARQRYFERNRADLDALMSMYMAAFEKAGARVLVDASKSPFYAVNLLYPRRPFDVVFLHLVRDPRAVLHSWKKTKEREDGAGEKLFPRYSSVRSLSQWALINSRCERFRGLAPDAYCQVRYEDFAENWHGALLDGAAALFERPAGAAMDDGRKAFVTAQHSISGNPSRFSLGEVELRPDTSWRDALTALDRRLAAMICGPAARRYGYMMH